jgi:hypothetical protein
MCHVPGPHDVATVMRPFGIWWAIAGGWAIDLWLGVETREHHDVEVVVQRKDQSLVHELLRDSWNLSCIDPPGSGWCPWRVDQQIVSPSFQLQVSNPTCEFDVFLESVVDEVWIFRRDARIRQPIDNVVSVSMSGIPVVSPEVQLLYMAKSAEPKNQHDFEVALPRLSRAAATRLNLMLAVVHPHHRWRDELP